MAEKSVYRFRVEPQEVDFSLRATIPALGSAVLNTAGVDAQRKGFGVDALNRDNFSWVLSRMALEVDARPRQYAEYDITTWVNEYGRVLSTRNFTLCDAGGREFGRAVTQWCMIDLAAIAAALCVLALGFRKQLHLQRLLPALLGLSLALAWCGVYRAVLLRPIEAFCARQQAEISAEVLEYPTSSRYGRAVLVCVEAEPRSIRAVLYYSSDETLLPGDRVTCTAKLRAASPDNLERDEYYASRGVWMCASAKGELTVEAGTRSLRYFPVYAAERLKRV